MKQTYKKSYTLKELATLTECRLIGNPDHLITGVADLETADSEDASFFSNPRYQEALRHSQAGVIFVDSGAPLDEGRNYLVSAQPSRSFQELVDRFHPQRKEPSGFTGIHPTAVIHPSAILGEGVSIGPYAVIDEGVKIGQGTFIGSGTYVGPGTSIGEYSTIHPRVVIREDCTIGDRVILQPGVVIGSCGFGYTTEKNGHHLKLNQVGDVRIENDVEIGANTTIDRSRFKSTVVGEGSKLDNLIQLGHGVILGPHNLIIAQTGIAGSSSTGRHVVLGGQVAVAGHIHLSDGVMVAGKSGVTKSLPSGKYGGIPAQPLHEYNRNQVFLRNIEKAINRLKEIEKKIFGS